MAEPLFNWLTTRGAGILLHPTSLPGDTGIGTLGQQARRFVDFLADVGMKYWQVCPLGPTGYGDSPYQCFSAFAGNPYLIDLDDLKQEGLLQEADVMPLRNLPAEHVDYGAQWHSRWMVLHQAFANFAKTASGTEQEAFRNFRTSNADWLEAYTLFMAIKGLFESRSWLEWPKPFRRYRTAQKREEIAQLTDQISAHAFYQFKFFQQWESLKAYANERRILIFGDIPIFVAMDSADVWRRPSLFQMDPELLPTGVAGVPPDYFSADGQLWGNPLYAWENHAKNQFAWWCARLQKSFELYDVVRIDHFRGFDQYCRIPPNATNAREYSWLPGPGLPLFEVVRERFPDAKLVAEDLGIITDSVRDLMRRAGLPGMKVLQFAFEGATEYLPHNTIPNSVLYPGTHDNDTSWGWFGQQPEGVKKYLSDYLQNDTQDVPWSLIHAGYASSSRIFIAPFQDYLGLGSEARMNRPGQPTGNWKWRYQPAQLDRLWGERGALLKDFARLYER
ncbi:MAG: 4-alpha-glucanotransferase [Verrucomicrobia bacterium]|nr:4-alpha-glucanotransferase [Verrucomicrobiota bacterium]